MRQEKGGYKRMSPSQGFNTSLTIPKRSKSHGLSENVITVIVEG